MVMVTVCHRYYVNRYQVVVVIQMIQILSRITAWTQNYYEILFMVNYVALN